MAVGSKGKAINGQIIGQGCNHLTQQWCEDGRFAVGGDSFGPANAAHRPLDFGILGQDGMARLLAVEPC